MNRILESMVCSFHRNKLYEVIIGKVLAIREGNDLIRRTVKNQYRFRVFKEITLTNIVYFQSIKQRARHDDFSVKPDQSILPFHDTFKLIALHYGSG